MLFLVYAERLDKLQSPMPLPKRCQSYHCDTKPLCYTNYLPHYPTDMKINDLLVGNTNWTYSGEELQEWSTTGIIRYSNMISFKTAFTYIH